MGQEQSYAHSNVQVRRYKDKYDDPTQYRGSVEYRTSDTQGKDYDYKRHRARRSADSYKSDNSSTESSGYRSGSSVYECSSDRSTKAGYYCTSLYKNDNYKDINKEIYKPVKISKEKRYKLQLFEAQKDELQSARLKSYSNEAETAKFKGPPKNSGIRNYTPKILSEEEQKKKSDWL